LLPLYPGDTDGYALAMNNPMNEQINMCGATLDARNMSADDVEPRSTAQVVGYSTSASGVCHAFVWSEEGGAEVLPDLGGGSACAKDINEYGEICGWAKDASGRVRAVLWRHIPGSAPTPFLRSAGPMPSPGLQPGPVDLSGWQVTTKNILVSGGRASYIQLLEYPFGIKIRGSYGLRQGDLVDFSGILSISHGEKQLNPRKMLFQGFSNTLPLPFGGSHRSLAGSCPNGLVTGLRVKIWGKVLEIIPFFPGYRIRLDDGSHLVESDAFTYYPLDNEGQPIFDQPIFVPEVYGICAYVDEAYQLEVGDFVCIEGVCSVLLAKTLLPQIVDAEVIYTQKPSY
jgi:probable HAF family extracellular repeat protein